jgi:hypothetical protein
MARIEAAAVWTNAWSWSRARVVPDDRLFGKTVVDIRVVTERCPIGGIPVRVPKFGIEDRDTMP